MSALMSLFIWVAGALLTVLLFFVDLFLAIILYPFDKQRRIVHAQCFWWSDAIINMNPFWSIEIVGREKIDPKRTYVITANHQSLGDIVVLYQTKAQFKWVSKDSLFRVPFLGGCLSLCKHIRLERGDMGSIKKVYRQAAEWLRAGMSVLFFPEGTRSDTDEMNPFQNGAFKLAIKEKVPVLPIAVSGTRDAIPKGSWIFNHKVYCKITVLDPIETADMSPADFEKLKDTVRENIKKYIQ
jgi:1-acyl-sn-glycerol-3-phosphate acyltransferase